MIEIVGVTGLASVQDLGRPGFLHMGVPVGGAMIPHALRRANARVGNAPSAPAIEVVGALRIVARIDVEIATDDLDAVVVAAGATWELPANPHVRYVAIRGGIDVPEVLGGRGTLLVASIGGHEGRALVRGDVLALGNVVDPSAATGAPTSRAEIERAGAGARADDATKQTFIRVVPGPDRACFARGVEALVATTWSVSVRRDRVGIALAGGRVPRTDGGPVPSAPMIRGAIEVPPSGEPIVLGPDHPTTGGYPIVAVVIADDVGVLYARSVGAPVRFAIV